jgi:transposase-like protein
VGICTVDGLKRISEDLYKSGCVKAVDFNRKYSNFIVTFARLVIEGRKVPWNTNIIERLMGEISKRAKHKWMMWTTRGLEAIMRIILTRYSCERIHETFKRNIMRNNNLNYIKYKVNII